ncbi:Hypothetical predicted protein [Cloeon dipterum]|uniref:Gustatory receptor n=1 Tax=Cloeon dipterum TaxID=197152 RepID=A0A8S1CKK9_9INSE|nr:Hypothetical predicted protein [Cloeon dipterum]
MEGKESTLTALYTFLGPALFFGVKFAECRANVYANLTTVYSSVILTSIIFQSVHIITALLGFFQGRSSESVIGNKNHTLTVLMMLQKILSIAFVSVTLHSSVFKSREFTRLLEKLDKESRRMKCEDEYLKRLKRYCTKFSLFRYSVCAIAAFLESWAWIKNPSMLINMTNIIFITILWLVMEWCLIVVTNATRFLFCQLIIKIEEPVCTPKTLRTFRTSFRKLCLIICRTNEYFQLVLLTTFTISFYNLLSAFYFMAILTFDLEEGFSETKFQMIVGCCIWGSLSLAQFFHLCLSCERTTKEVGFTLIHINFLIDIK